MQEDGSSQELLCALYPLVGGEANVAAAARRGAKLTLTLKDESLADMQALAALPEVGHLTAAGAVDEDGNAVEEDNAGSGKKSPVSMLIDVISGTLQPTLGVLAATGIIKGLLALFDFIGLIPATSGTYQIWYAVADGFFYFLPIILGYTAAKKFKMNEFIGIALCYPAMVNSTAGEVLGVQRYCL